MKRLLYCLFLFLGLSSCNKDDDKIDSPYTEEQKEVLSIFHGKFKTDDNTRTMEFLEVYDMPKEISVSVFPEVSYNDKIFGKIKTSWTSFEDTYYFSLSKDAKYMYTYDIVDNGNVSSRDKIPLKIINENEFNLYPLTIVNPHKYIRIE